MAQVMVECYLGKQLVTVIPEEAVPGQRMYWEKQGRGQDFWVKTPNDNQATAEALKSTFIKKIK